MATASLLAAPKAQSFPDELGLPEFEEAYTVLPNASMSCFVWALLGAS